MNFEVFMVIFKYQSFLFPFGVFPIEKEQGTSRKTTLFGSLVTLKKVVRLFCSENTWNTREQMGTTGTAWL